MAHLRLQIQKDLYRKALTALNYPKDHASASRAIEALRISGANLAVGVAEKRIEKDLCRRRRLGLIQLQKRNHLTHLTQKRSLSLVGLCWFMLVSVAPLVYLGRCLCSSGGVTICMNANVVRLN